MKKLLALLTAFAMLPCIANAEDEYFSAELSSLKALLDECNSKKISVPYEEVAYTTLERFATYIPEDEAVGVDEAQLEYNRQYMQGMHPCPQADLHLSRSLLPPPVQSNHFHQNMLCYK